MTRRRSDPAVGTDQSTQDDVTERVIGELIRWEREDAADFALIQLRMFLRETCGASAASQVQTRELSRRVFPGLPTAEALAGAQNVRLYRQHEERRRATVGGFAWERERAVRMRAWDVDFACDPDRGA